jgi:hypothetical protein
LNSISSIFPSVPKTCIENLSNELFYEIFDYLDVYNIYKSFLNLNDRFRHLITSPSFALKIHLHSEEQTKLIQTCEKIIIPNRQRILSLNLENNSTINDFFTYCIIDSSFINLQSIILKSVDTDNCMMSLFYLKSLPRLFVLTIYINEREHCNLNGIYRRIFAFPSLKYSKISLVSHSQREHTLVSIPLAINEKFSTVEYLIIDHRCHLDELFYMLSHTPRLRQLTCRNLVESWHTFRNKNQIILSNLTHIYIDIVGEYFDEYQMFFTNVVAPVQMLRIKDHRCRNGSSAHDWQHLIKSYIPYLRIFNYEYNERYPYETDDIPFFMKINQFTSSFWIERQWFFNFTMHMDKEYASSSIHPYRYIHDNLFYR